MSPLFRSLKELGYPVMDLEDVLNEYLGHLGMDKARAIYRTKPNGRGDAEWDEERLEKDAMTWAKDKFQSLDDEEQIYAAK